MTIAEGASYLDWDDSFLGSIIPSLLKKLNNQNIREVLQVLGNSPDSDGLLVELFDTESDGSITFNIPLQKIGVD